MTQRPVAGVAGFGALHFVLALTTAFVAEGWDLDQLRSRSPLGRAAGVAHDVLMYPHDATLRAIPNAWVAGGSALIPTLLLLNSLLWGGALYAIHRAAARRDRGGRGGRGRAAAPVRR